MAGFVCALILSGESGADQVYEPSEYEAAEYEYLFSMSTGPVPVRTKLVMDLPSAAAGISFDWADAGPRFLSGGIRTSLFTAGTVSHYGIFRELNDPAGFSAESSVFLEADRFSLYRGLQKCGRFGLTACFPSVRDAYLFCRYEAAGTVTAGLCGDLYIRDRLRVFLYGSGSIFPPPKHEENTWFFQAPEDALGPAAGHGAVKAVMRGKRLVLSAAVGVSCSETAPPGSFFRLLAELRLPRLKLRGVFSQCGGRYFSPQGKYPGNVRSFGASADFRVLKPFYLEAAYTRTMKRLQPVPAFCRGTSDNFRVETGIAADRFDLSAEWERRFTIDDSGDFGGGDNFRLQISGIRDFSRRVGAPGGDWGGELEGEALVSPYAPPAWKGSGEFRVNTRRWSCKLKTALTVESTADVTAETDIAVHVGRHTIELNVTGTFPVLDLYGAGGGNGSPYFEVTAGYRLSSSRAVSK